MGELLEDWDVNQQPSQPLTKLEGSETNSWNSKREYNTDKSAQHPIKDDDIVQPYIKMKCKNYKIKSL